MRDERATRAASSLGAAGIWQEDADGTDVNACARSNQGERQLIATADDFGKVLFRYPHRAAGHAIRAPLADTTVSFSTTTAGSSRRRRPRRLPVEVIKER